MISSVFYILKADLFCRTSYNTLDIFQFFEDHAYKKTLPSFDTLLAHATELYKAYGTTRGYDNAMVEADENSKWAKTVPRGSTWMPPPTSNSSLEPQLPRKAKTAKPKARAKKKPKQTEPIDTPPKPVAKDHVLGQSIALVRDSLVSKKLAISVAEGDVGRIYECSKVRNYFFYTITLSHAVSIISKCYSLSQDPDIRTI